MVSRRLTLRVATKRLGGALSGMDIRPGLLLIALLLPVSPVLAQDWLAPLQELADQITPPKTRTTPPKNTGTSRPVPPTPPVVDKPVVAPVAPPIPLPRPDFAQDDETSPDDGAADAAAPETTPGNNTPSLTEEPASEPTPVAAPKQPGRVYQTACPALLQGLVSGQALAPITENQCGTRSPLEITGVLSRGRMVPFSGPVTTDCAMASALPGWIETVDGYAATVLKSPLARINTGPGYVCRLRNNASDGLVSEHGFANALDVSGFILEDGRAIAVKTDWLPGNASAGRLLRLAHDAACGQFTTVLGPEANADHQDHIHLDLGCHGKSCTAQICE